MKSIGHWYVRRARRSLACLVIDNRHAVERLRGLEDQTSLSNLDLIESEQPLAFADVFPLSASNHKRGQSPERKFIVAFRHPTRGWDDDSRPSPEPDMDLLQAGPSTPYGDRFLCPITSLENRSPQIFCTDSDAVSIGEPTRTQSTRKARTRARPADEQTTSRLILDVIPHEEAEETFKSAQNMGRSTLLKAMAEETIDTLMRHWTYVDPEYFSEDDCSSVPSTEPSRPMLRNRNPQHYHEVESTRPAENLSSSHQGSRRKGSEFLENSDPIEQLAHSQCVPLEEGSETSFALPVGRHRNAKKRPIPLSPTPQNVQAGQGAKARSLSPKPSDRALQSPKEPSSPAPPYPSSPRGQCPSCLAVSAGASSSCADNRPCQPPDSPSTVAETGNETSPLIDNAIRLFEAKLLEVIKQPSLQNVPLNAQSRQVNEQQEIFEQSVTTEQEAEPVILKDCLGRKFLFPFQKCKSWQVSTRRLYCTGSKLT